jgi:tetratricopeptide (TPR) repeat protein
MQRSNLNGAIILGLAVLCLLNLPNLGQSQPVDAVSQAVSLFDSSRYDEARVLLDSYLPDHPQEAKAAAYRGRLALIQDDLDNAMEWTEKALKLEDGNAEYHFWMAQTYGMKAQRSGKIKQAFLAPKVKREFERAVELDPKLIPARLGLIQYYLMAPGIMGGSKEKAAAQVQVIKEQDSLQGRLATIMLYENNNENDKARAEYLALIKDYPDSTNYKYQLGYFYQGNKEFEAAFSLYEEILAVHPEDLIALYQIGRTGALSGLKADRAAACLQLYLRSNPGTGKPPLDAAHFRLGQVYEKSSQKALAIQEYEAALKINPRHEQAKEALKKLK